MFFKQKSPIILNMLLVVIIFTLAGFGCKGGSSEAQQQVAEPVKLTWWRVEGSQNNFKDIIKEYQTAHPNVSVTLKIVRAEELEQNLLEALASGTGPDLVSLPNTSIVAWQDRLVPLPATLTLPAIEITGWLKKEPTVVLKTTPTMNMREFQSTFVETVAKDVVINNKIYGLPLSLDTLLLYYNRDLLNASDIPNPPATWGEFSDDVVKLTKLDKQGKILQSGTALGETTNVPYAADIVSALMLQNGTPIVDEQGSTATFAREVKRGSEVFTPGADALRFYTDFANPVKETYTWSRDESSAFEAFTGGKVALVFGLWKDRAILKSLSPKLNFEVANFPQIDPNVNPLYYASYYTEVVAKQSKHPNEAWDFLLFITQPNQVEKYLNMVKAPTAHRALVKKQMDDVDLVVPAKQILTARSWYHGYKPKLAFDGLLAMVRQFNAGSEIDAALQFGAAQVTQSLQKTR